MGKGTGMDSFGKVVGIFIGIVLMFLFPILYYAQKQDAITQTYVLTETSYFVDNVKNSGYISQSMYQRFIKKLDATNNLYTIEIEHAHLVINPVYNESTNVFMNDFKEHTYVTYTDTILDQIYGTNKIYKFNQGDYLTVKVYNKTKTYATKLQEMLFSRRMPVEQIYVVYGGAIRDENY